jgi:ubiquinone/menaquinone biosynthesis C-methylase UbiE
LAKSYDAKQPHFMPENVARVESIMADLAAKTGGGRLLDLGCGTGFILKIGRKYFKRVVGVDITQAMLDLAETTGRQVELYKADTSNLSFLPANAFDVCTAYSFLHHLLDFEPTMREAFRCLRPGGIFYSDQDPNFYYWQLMKSIKDLRDLPEVVQREVQFVVHSLEESAAGTGLSPEEVALAEYHDIQAGGINPDLLVSVLEKIGFASVKCRYEWFLGQGRILHHQSADDAGTIERFLRDTLPASRCFFKYLSFYAQR